MRPLPLRVTRRILVCVVWLSSCLVCAAHADNVADSVGNVIWDYAAGERTTISRYGNWLGPGWWGGSELSSRVGMLPPVDDLDAVAQKHDFGYELAEKLGKGRPNVEAYYKSVADMIAIRDTMTLNPDPTKWTHPAANPEQAKIFMDRLRIGFTYYQQKMHELKAGLPNAPADIADPAILDNVTDGILGEKQLEARMLMRISQWEREHRKWQATKKAQVASAQGGQQSGDGQKISGEPSNSQTAVAAQQTDASAHADLLNAICRCTSSCTARVYYSTTPVAESPSCNDPSNGPCVCSGMGCMRSVMSPLCVVKKYQEAKGQQLNVGNVLNFIDKYSGPKPAAQDPASIFPLVRKGEALHLYIKSPGKEEEKWLWQSSDARTFRATRLSPGTAPSTEIVNLKKPSMGHLIFERPGGGKILAMRDVMNGGFQDGITDNVPAGTTVVGVVTPDTAPQTPEPGPQTAAGSEPVDEEGSGASGYELYFDGKLVSGPDAAYYTRQQAQENCDWNMQTKPQIRIRCVYNGTLLRERQPKEPQGSGYELYFDGKLVSGPDAAYYTLKQAQENCDWNRRTKPHIHIDCVYNGRPLRE